MVQILLALLAGSMVLDAFVRPRPEAGRVRTAGGIWLGFLLSCLPFGLFLGLGGNALVALAFALGLIAVLAMTSNAKRALLGESLAFSDLSMLSSVIRHPQFYFSALNVWQKIILTVAALLAPGTIALTFRADPAAHLTGLGLAIAAILLLGVTVRVPPWSQWARHPDLDADILRHGLLPVLFLYWLRWRKCPDPAPVGPIAALPAADELAILIQCESFADPADLFGDAALTLPGLSQARQSARRWGNLDVSGFGAYTMRTEYGLLFGRDEAELGFRRFDPFLTALNEASLALPMRLSAGGWRSLFLHPHDMRFYNRHEIMPSAGFAELVGQDRFSAPAAGEGRYVTDDAVANVIMDMARSATEPTLIYAVTIENHGPWAPGPEGEGPTDGYLRLVRNGDAMLMRLSAELAALQRPATLVFFGDHRPSIPGVSNPDGPRHTPYIVLQFDGSGQVRPGRGERVDLTPAQLHHCLLELWSEQQADR